MLPVRRILCPTDYSPPACIALTAASELASLFEAELYVLHVVPTMTPELEPGVYPPLDSDREKLESGEEELRAHLAKQIPENAKVHTRVRLGNAPDEILRAANQEHIDLIVIATHGLSGWRHFVFGSVAEKVLRAARHPILVIREPHAQRPPSA